MDRRLETEGFTFEYKETRIESRVLWENHCHAQFEMLAVLEGDIRIMPEGKTYRLCSDQIAIIPPLLYHTVTANKQGDYRRLTVLFDLASLPAVLRPRFADKTADLSIVFFDRLEEFRKILLDDDPNFYAPLADSLMVEILYRDAQAKESDPKGEVDTCLGELLGYIDRHLCEKILLEDLAAHIARSKSSVCHLFTEKMNTSPKQYILQKKLALADQWIRGGMPPTLAAMRVGYDNYSNFYRLYRKHFGAAPAKTARG